jgi:serine/threonine protein phosphatase 1
MKIKKPDNGKRFVIADIHGCINTLKALIEDKIQPTKHDYLFFLGDYIDRGPNGPAVIDYILKLIEHGYKIFPLRGNHEENLLKARIEYDDETFIFYVSRMNKSLGLIDENAEIKQKYFDFFKNLEYYYEMDDFILVHAGINFNAPKPFEDYISMLELRKTIPNKALIGNKLIVHGHQPNYLNDIIEAVNTRNTLIPLDNGCSYTKPHKLYDYKRLGNLCCLNLEDFELIVQKNEFDR